MFSRILKSARSLVSPTPTTEPEAAPPTSWKPIAIPKATPAKKTRSPKAKPSIEQATPDFEKHTHFSAELPIAIPKESRVEQPLITVTQPTPHRTRVHSPDMVTTRAQQEQQEDSSDDHSINVYVPGTMSTRKSASRKRNATSLDAIISQGTPSRSAKKRKVAALPVRKKAETLDEQEDSEQEDSELDDLPLVVNSTPVVEIRVNKALIQEAKNGGSGKKHKKFGSDDEQAEEDHIFSTAQEIQDVEEDESSDDDAPEEVGAQTAVQKAKAQAESAKQAIQSQKQQRKERAAKAQAQPKKSKRQIHETGEEDDEEQGAIAAPGVDMKDDETAEFAVEYAGSALSPPRRVNYMVLDKPVKDRVIGQTTYRINRKQSSNLASKASRDSRNIKEVLLHARGPRSGSNRGQAKKNFF